MGRTQDVSHRWHRLLLLVMGVSFLGWISTASVNIDPTAGCPSAGAANPAHLSTLSLGRHPTLVFFNNLSLENDLLVGELEQYHVTTRTTSVLLKLPDALISEAQLSPDGQWIALMAYFSSGAQVRLIRLDGQAQQTLYCANTVHAGSYDSVSALQWAPDQQSLAFSELGFDAPVYLLTLKTGAVHSLLSARTQQDTIYSPVAWLDPTHLYLEGEPIGSFRHQSTSQPA